MHVASKHSSCPRGPMLAACGLKGPLKRERLEPRAHQEQTPPERPSRSWPENARGEPWEGAELGLKGTLDLLQYRKKLGLAPLNLDMSHGFQDDEHWLAILEYLDHGWRSCRAVRTTGLLHR